MANKVMIYFPEKNEFGVRVIEIAMWSGIAYFIPRVSIHKVLEREEMNRPGIYFLKSVPNSVTFSERIYIGEGENIKNRIKQQLVDPKKDFDEIIVFLSKDEFLTKTQIKYLESKIITLAKEAKSAEIVNTAAPSLPRISEYDIPDIDDYLSNIRLILPLMGFNFLKSFRPKNDSADKALTSSMYHINSKNFQARMYETQEGFIVLKGSQANKNYSKSLRMSYVQLRQKLIDTGILRDKKTHYEFIQDTIFSSPSAASNTVLGRQSAGPLFWLDDERRTYKQVVGE
jgi:hypothetical protein